MPEGALSGVQGAGEAVKRRKRKAKSWRVQSDADGGFDELVLGEHVHLEMMSEEHLWARIGDHVININITSGTGTHRVELPEQSTTRRR